MLREIIESPQTIDYQQLGSTAHRGWMALAGWELEQAAQWATEGLGKATTIKKHAVSERVEHTANLAAVAQWYFRVLLSITKFWQCLKADHPDEAWNHLVTAEEILDCLERFIDAAAI